MHYLFFVNRLLRGRDFSLWKWKVYFHQKCPILWDCGTEVSTSREIDCGTEVSTSRGAEGDL